MVFVFNFPISIAAIKATLIYPATQKHIDKYSQHEPYIINETAEDYKTITLPHIESKAFSIQVNFAS
jgi:m7GpppX diphosphatase